jgi:hypothetical protein
LLIGAAHIALHDGGAAIMPGTDRPLTFNGQPSITIPCSRGRWSGSAGECWNRVLPRRKATPFVGN